MNLKSKTIKLGEQELTIETGKMAKQTDGSCLVRYGETMVLVTAVSDKKPKDISFLPLTVDYREKNVFCRKNPWWILQARRKAH